MSSITIKITDVRGKRVFASGMTDNAKAIAAIRSWSEELKKATNGLSAGNLRDEAGGAVGKLMRCDLSDRTGHVSVCAQLSDSYLVEQCATGKIAAIELTPRAAILKSAEGWAAELEKRAGANPSQALAKSLRSESEELRSAISTPRERAERLYQRAFEARAERDLKR